MIGSIARRYAKAIFSLAQDESTLEPTGDEIERLAAVAADPELAAALANPLLSSTTRRAIARSLAERLDLRPTTRNFVALLADHQRLDQLVGIADQYRRLVDRALGRVRVQITSATALTAEQQERVVAAFARKTGRSVLPTVSVEPALLGGVIVEVEGKVYDGSVRTQLTRLAGNIAGSRSHL